MGAGASVVLLTAVLLAALISLIWWQRWRQAQLLATVEIVTLEAVPSTHLGNTRPIYVCLPPGYGETNHSYPTLYVNDGQDREALNLHHTLARLQAKNKISPLVVIAIPTNENRLHEYGTAVSPNAQGLGSQAAAYTRFVCDELMPLIRQQFRVCSEATQTAILGASLGGLSAFDIAWNHPDRFGIVGVMSGSFWWRAAADDDDDENITPNALIVHEMVRQGFTHPGQRFWFEAGTRDEVSDRDNNGVIDAIQDTLELIEALEAKGYRRGYDIQYVEVIGGRHNYHTWSQVLPQFLRWAFG